MRTTPPVTNFWSGQHRSRIVFDTHLPGRALVHHTIHDNRSPGVPLPSSPSDRYLTACTELVHLHYLRPRGEQVPVLVTLLLRPPPPVEAPTHKVVGFIHGSDMPGARSTSFVCERATIAWIRYMPVFHVMRPLSLGLYHSSSPLNWVLRTIYLHRRSIPPS